MRILVLAPQPYYIDRGTPIDVDLLLLALGESGHQVDLLVYRVGEERKREGVTIHRAGPRGHFAPRRPGFSLRKLLADVPFFLKAMGLVRTREYDVIHAGEESVYMALVFRSFFGVPYVYDMDSSLAQQMVERFGWLRPLARILAGLEGLAIRRSLVVAPVCNALADLAAEAGDRPVVTLHDISRMRTGDFRGGAEVRERLGLAGTVVMYVGNLEPYQGVDLLMDAFRWAQEEESEMTLVIAGGTPSAVRQGEFRAAKLGILEHTRFLGPWPSEELGPLLSAGDILAAPRLKGINTPMKIFPYLHSGVPVLATDLPTHTQILDSDVAELAPPDPQLFGTAMVRLARDPERRRRLGEGGRAFVERSHTLAAHRRRVAELYDRVREEMEPGQAREAGVS